MNRVYGVGVKLTWGTTKTDWFSTTQPSDECRRAGDFESLAGALLAELREAPSGDEALVVVAFAEAVCLHLSAARRGVDEVSAADVDPYVANAVSAGGLEEDKVSGLEVVSGDFGADPGLLCSGSRKANAMLRHCPEDESGAIEGRRAARSPHVPGSGFAFCGGQHLLDFRGIGVELNSGGGFGLGLSFFLEGLEFDFGYDFQEVVANPSDGAAGELDVGPAVALSENIGGSAF